MPAMNRIYPLAAIGLMLCAGCNRACKSGAPQINREAASTAGAEQAILSVEWQIARLQSRARSLWTAKVNKDWERVFEFHDPSAKVGLTDDERLDLQREFVEWSETKEVFLVEDFEIGRVEVEGERGWVENDYKTLIRNFEHAGVRSAKKWEKWQLVDGEWYPLPPDQLVLFPEAPVLRDASEEAHLLARFEESWLARAQADWDHLAKLYDPREDFSVPEGEAPVVFLDCDVQWVEVMADHGKVGVFVTYKLNDPNLMKMRPRTDFVVEPWVKYIDDWYMQAK